MRIYYGKAVYDQKEIKAALNVLKNKSLTLIDGPSVKELENKVAKIFGKKYGLMVNSGSSANLLANVAWRDSYGRLDWRDLAFLTSVGATLCVRYAKTGKSLFSSR